MSRCCARLRWEAQPFSRESRGTSEEGSPYVCPSHTLGRRLQVEQGTWERLNTTWGQGRLLRGFSLQSESKGRQVGETVSLVGETVNNSPGCCLRYLWERQGWAARGQKGKSQRLGELRLHCPRDDWTGWGLLSSGVMGSDYISNMSLGQRCGVQNEGKRMRGKVELGSYSRYPGGKQS